MNLKELKEKVDFLITIGRGDCEVIIDLDRPSVGARAGTAVESVYPGIDWESGQVRLSPRIPLIEKCKNRDAPMVKRKSSTGQGWICPACGGFTRRGDLFCSSCGQRLDE